MKFVKYVSLTIGILFLLGMTFYAYMGGFSKVEVKRETFGPVSVFVYPHKGPYKNLHQSWEKFQKLWEAVGITECSSMAIYLDTPDTPEENLRSILACRMDGLSVSQIKAVKSQLTTFEIPKSDSLTSSFPFRNVLSYFLAPTKVYPKFQEIISENKEETSVAIEVYGGSAQVVDTIKFYMPLGIKRDVFLALETLF